MLGDAQQPRLPGKVDPAPVESIVNCAWCEEVERALRKAAHRLFPLQFNGYVKDRFFHCRDDGGETRFDVSGCAVHCSSAFR